MIRIKLKENNKQFYSDLLNLFNLTRYYRKLFLGFNLGFVVFVKASDILFKSY